jgi:hypothetical protein
MKITKDSARLCGSAEKDLSEEEALKLRMAEKSKELVEKGAEVYTIT